MTDGFFGGAASAAELPGGGGGNTPFDPTFGNTGVFDPSLNNIGAGGGVGGDTGGGFGNFMSPTPMDLTGGALSGGLADLSPMTNPAQNLGGQIQNPVQAGLQGGGTDGSNTGQGQGQGGYTTGAGETTDQYTRGLDQLRMAQGQAPTGPQVDTFYSLTDGKLFGLPVPLVYVLILAVIMGVALRHSRWGRYVFVLGGNEKAAKLTGVPVDRVKISVYVLCALSAGFAGILITGWLGSAPANLATGYELKIIAASVIGGADLAGGVGGPVGAVIGSALIEVIRNGLALFGADTYWEQVFVGTIIILAVLVDRIRTREPE